MIVRAPAMRALYEQVTRAARSTCSVLILGELGVDKELLARAVHDRSPRARKPFVELIVTSAAGARFAGSAARIGIRHVGPARRWSSW